MPPSRATVTASAALAVAAVTGVSASVALATGDEQTSGFSVAVDAETPAAGRGMTAKGLSEKRTRSGDRARTADGISEQEASPPPRGVSVPALGVRAPVVPTGVTKAGNAQIPTDGDVVGWYEFGAAPGDRRGSAVLVGHRDTRAEGPGALFDLDQLQPGARISVDEGRQIVRYRVVTLRSTEKAGLPDTLFRRTGPHQLVLITCGGPYIADAGGYQENLFAIAVPVRGSK
ncbi:MAG: class F sortase [Actinomycetes bacterium]